MTCGFRTSAGTDLDDLFLTTGQNAGAVGFRQSDGLDVGNKYTDETILGYSVGYRNSAGTDIGYLRGREFSQPRWGDTGLANVFFGQNSVRTTCREESGDDYWEYECDDCRSTYVLAVIAPTLANYQSGQSYTLVVDQVLWTTTGDSKGGACYGFFPSMVQGGSLDLTNSSAVEPEVRYPFYSSNSHDATNLTGNRHNQSDLDKEESRWRVETPFIQGEENRFRVYWGRCWTASNTKWQCRYLIRNEANGKDTGWFYSDIYTCED